MKISLVGVTGYSGIHLRELLKRHQTNECELVAVTVVNPEQAREQRPEAMATLAELAIPIVADYASMLEAHAAQCDLIVVPTGIHLHESMVCAALAADCDVLVEKPLAGDLAAVDRIRQAEAESGKRVMVGFQHFAAPSAIAIEQALSDGLIGQVQSVSVLGLWPRPKRYYQRNNWAARRAVNGLAVNDAPFHNAFAHHVFAASRFVAQGGKPIYPESASGTLLRARDIETCDGIAASLQFGNGAEVHILLSHSIEHHHNPQFTVEGELGTITWMTSEAAAYQLHTGESGKLGAHLSDQSLVSTFWSEVLDYQQRSVRVCDSERAAVQVACTEQFFTLSTINCAADVISRTAGDELDDLPVVPGLERTLHQCFAERRILNDDEITKFTR